MFLVDGAGAHKEKEHPTVVVEELSLSYCFTQFLYYGGC